MPDNHATSAIRTWNDYARLPLDLVPAQDYIHERATLKSWIFECDREKVQLEIDLIFADHLDVKIAAPAVLMTALYVRDASSSDPYYRNFGFSEETDVAFWVPVKIRTADDDWDFFWLPFFMFVDSGLALVAGREVFGFPKQIAEIVQNDSDYSSQPIIEIKTQYFPKRAAGSDPGQNRAVHGSLLKLQRHSSGAAAGGLGLSSFLNDFQDAIFGDEDRPDGSQLAPPYLSMPPSMLPSDGFAAVKTPMIMVKQFRRAEERPISEPESCYKAVIAIDTQSYGSFDMVPADSGPVELIVSPSISHPIIEKLALVSTVSVQALPVIENLNFKVGYGRLL